MKEKIIVRMPPSPTGSLHLGTARTALFNWCFAKANKGDIIFRWEDTDRERSKSKFETEILEGLKWLGMDFVAESTKFVRQTENAEKHEFALQKLWNDDQIFPCFTTTEQLDTLRTQAQKNKQNFVFWSPFRDKDKTELEKLMQTDKPYVWRLKVPKNKIITFNDLVKGEISVNTDTLGDFVVARSDGSVLYLLANVVDDLDNNITHVIRGDDHISNTPKQICLLSALNEKPFIYGHIPLVLDKSKKKLSKRNVEEGVCILIPDFKEKGFIPEAVINGLAFLGWNPKTTEEIFSLQNLEEIFDLKKVNPAAAQYDFGKMEWFNTQWISKIDLQKLKNYFLDWNANFGKRKNSEYLNNEILFDKALELVKKKTKSLAVIAEELEYLCFDIQPEKDISIANEKMKVDETLALKVLKEIKNMLENIPQEEFNASNLREKSIERISEMGLKNGQFLWPFRVALSGKSKSAGPFDMAEIFGKEKSLEKIIKIIKE